MSSRCACPPGQNPFARPGLGRRQMLRATGAGFVATLTAALTDFGRTARAQGIGGQAPVVDRLAVRIVTDNHVDRFSLPTNAAGIGVERPAGFEQAGTAPHATLQAEWGLSMLAESVRGAETRRVMIDFGYTPEALLTNMGLLGIDPASIDAMVLSHGHMDHFGGLMGLLAAAGPRLKPNLPLFVGGEDCFCARHTGAGADFGVVDRPGLLAAGLQIMLAEGPALAAGHAITSGQISRTSFERVLPASTERSGLAGGLGCDPALLPAAKNTGGFVADDFQHEIATSYVVRGKGLVVLTSCSHRGVLNAVRQAQAASGVTKLHAVIGGFHLVPPLSDDYVRQAVAELKALEPDFVIPAHCAGERFYDMARAEMPGRVIASAVGSRFTFGALTV